MVSDSNVCIFIEEVWSLYNFRIGSQVDGQYTCKHQQYTRIMICQHVALSWPYFCPQPLLFISDTCLIKLSLHYKLNVTCLLQHQQIFVIHTRKIININTFHNLAKGIWKQDPEANIWAQAGWEWGVEKTPQWKFHSWFHLPNTVRVIKSRRLRWAGHVARIKEGRSAFKILTG